VVSNGYRKERTVLTDVCPVSVRIPRIHSRDGKSEKFVSKPVKPFRRRTPHMDEVLACTHLMGVSRGRMADVMGRMFGEESLKSLSVPMLSRLKKKWSAEHEEWSRGSLRDDQWVFLWVERSSKDKMCLLVAMGTTAGWREASASDQGDREREHGVLGVGLARHEPTAAGDHRRCLQPA